MPVEVLLTLAGIKLLKGKFSINKVEWNLVAGKAVMFMRKRLGGALPASLDSLLEKLRIDFYDV